MSTASVCRGFETSRRREVLSFTHHREVAALPPMEADELLDQAAHMGWSTRDLRSAVREFNCGPVRRISLADDTLNGFIDHYGDIAQEYS